MWHTRPLGFWPYGTQGCFRSSRVAHKVIWILAVWHIRTLLVAMWHTRPIRNGPWVPQGHYALDRLPHSRKVALGQGVRRCGKDAWAGCRGREAGSGRVPHGRKMARARTAPALSGPASRGKRLAYRPAWVRSWSALSVRSQVKPSPVRPKWPYAAVCW